MAISCTCPKCGQFCGFKDEYAGRKVRCLSCSSRFIVPEQNGQKAIALPAEPMEPLGGFYGSVLVDNFKVFVQKESLFGIILCIALTCFHFFAGNKDFSFTIGAFRPPLLIGWAVTFCCAGYLLWYFMEIINTTMMDNDFLPEILIGEGFVFIGEAVKSIYLFIAAFAIAVIPGAVAAALLEAVGLSYPWLKVVLAMLSLLMLPMILCLLGAGAVPWKVFRYDQIIRMMIKTVGPYILTSIILFTALIAMFLTVGLFAEQASGPLKTAALLFLRLIAVFLMLLAMRTLGLYARHYFGCFPGIISDEQMK